jgi:LCP family protein required for cell wall assembly
MSEDRREKRISPREQKRKKRKRRKIALVIELLVLVVLCGVLFVYSKLGKINYRDTGKAATNDLDDDAVKKLKGYTTIALLGVDSRDMESDKGSRSDSIMVAVLDNDKKKIRLMSVYRDSYLDIDGKGTFKKCNVAYARGGAKGAIEMLNRNIDLDIQDYVSVNWKALADAIDAVGGLTVDVSEAEAKSMGPEDYHNTIYDTSLTVGRKTQNWVKPGKQKLDGVQCVAYCRIRHNGVGEDFGRAGRQREILSLLVDKIKKGGMSKLNKVMDVVLPEISTSLSMSEIVTFAKAGMEYDIDATTGFPKYKRGADFAGSVVVPCTLEKNVILAHKFLYNDDDYKMSNTLKAINNKIINKSGFTEKDAVDLGDAKYDTGNVGDLTTEDNENSSSGGK